MRKYLVIGMVAAGMLAGASESAAQTGILPLAVGVRGGAAFPMGDFGEGDLVGTGWGFEANAQFRVAPMLAIYGAYDWFEFSLDEDVVGADESITDSGFAGGAMFWLPTGFIGVTPWIRGGAIYNKLGGDDDGEDGGDSTLGYEVGAGATFPLGLVISFTPAVRYRSYSPDDAGDVSYLVADLGLTFRF